jgi:galactarate dehydratase (D-threo-forming)
MKITGVQLTPVLSRRETGNTNPHVIVQLPTDGGLVGLGEMSDLAHDKFKFDLRDLKESLEEVLVNQDPLHWRPLCHMLQGRYNGYNRLREGVEIAIFDLVGKIKGQSIVEVLGGGYRDKVKVCYPIFRMFDMAEVEPNLARVDQRMAEGQDLFRLYCGGNVAADEAFLSAVREKYGSSVGLKSLDLSGRLPWKKAMAVLNRLLPYDPILVESVCDRRDLEGQYEVRSRIDKPISEHIRSAQQAYEFARNRWVDIFNLSLSGTGGFTEGLQMAEIAQAAGISCLVGTTQELSIGVAAQAMFGALLENLDFPSDMTGGLLYIDDVVKERVRYENGYLLVPDGPGVGMELDEDKLRELERPLSSISVRAW